MNHMNRPKRILKWAVPVDDKAHGIGRGRIVHVEMAPGAALPDHLRGERVVWVWVEHDSDDIENPRQAKVVGTSHMYDGMEWRPIGSAIDSQFVWHVIARDL